MQDAKFHLDENVDLAVADGLRRRGIDTTTSVDVNLLSSSDQLQLSFAIEQGRILISHDQDFLQILAQQQEHPGLAYCPMSKRTIGEIVNKLTMLWRESSAMELVNKIHYL